jgi:predicted nucleotidyltransferase
MTSAIERSEGGIDREAVARLLSAHRHDLARFHVRSLELFGSIVRDAARRDSDVDLLVTFDEPVDLLTFLELEELIGDLLGRKVDLVVRDSVKPLLRERIFGEAVRVF